MIVIVPGSNGEFDTTRLTRHDALLGAAGLIVCQLEIPTATVEALLIRARALGKTLILNPAPATGPLPAHWYGCIDYLIPNESEAGLLTGITVDSIASATAAGRQLCGAGVRDVIVTLGAQGAMHVTPKQSQHYPAPAVHAVDTTAAGDTFIGAFATALSEGLAVEHAIAFSLKAASLSVTRAGAQPSIPYRHELD